LFEGEWFAVVEGRTGEIEAEIEGETKEVSVLCFLYSSSKLPDPLTKRRLASPLFIKWRLGMRFSYGIHAKLF